MQTCNRSGFLPKNFSCGVTSCTPEVVHLFMRYTAVFAAFAQYHFGRFFWFIIAEYHFGRFYYVPVFTLGYTVLLRGVMA